MTSTKEKVEIMTAYLEGKDIAWSNSSLVDECEDPSGVHNVSEERPNCSPIWNWGQTKYEVVVPKYDKIIYINTQNSTNNGGIGISGMYPTKGQAKVNSGEWNDRVGIKVRIQEVD